MSPGKGASFHFLFQPSGQHPGARPPAAPALAETRSPALARLPFPPGAGSGGLGGLASSAARAEALNRQAIAARPPLQPKTGRRGGGASGVAARLAARAPAGFVRAPSSARPADSRGPPGGEGGGR